MLQHVFHFGTGNREEQLYVCAKCKPDEEAKFQSVIDFRQFFSYHQNNETCMIKIEARMCKNSPSSFSFFLYLEYIRVALHGRGQSERSSPRQRSA